MAEIVKIETICGKPIEYIDAAIDQGPEKKFYFTPDKMQAIVFYKPGPSHHEIKDRLESMVGTLSPLNDSETGEYWKNLLLGWPTSIIDGPELGYVANAIPNHFFFETGSMKGQAKGGKWFASAKLLKLLDPSERGNWQSYFKIAMLLSRAVDKIHENGFAHSDLSFQQVLADPKGVKAALHVDIDGLIIPGKQPPDYTATPNFTAPELVKTAKLDRDDSNRKIPCVKTDRHALAVMIYMLLLHRHPLRGGLAHDLDPATDEALTLGEKALFIEHPEDPSNRPIERLPQYMPWADVDQIPYTVTGPYLKKLFDMAFIDGLHNPDKRPPAFEWETALIKTVDLMQPCGNEKCEQGWFVFDTDNASKPHCPFCNWEISGSVPVLNFYSIAESGKPQPDQHRLVVYNNLYLYPWHASSRIKPNERLTDDDKKPVGYFAFHKGKWVFVNQNLPDMLAGPEKKRVAIGTMVELRDGKKILLSKGEGGRIVSIKVVKA